ncbi:MAG: hypothetical protein KDB61_10505, partial [Planctomycetes bacterium]|nr:hypothetical protein [Planctomycetota bacterium]
VISCKSVKDGAPIAASAQLVNADTGKVIASFAGAEVQFEQAKVDPTNKLLAFTAKGDLHIWPLDAGLDASDEAVQKRRAEQGIVLDLAPKDDWGEQEFQWTHDGEFLVTWPHQFFHATPTGKVQIWRRTGELLWTGPMIAQVSVHPMRNRICAVYTDHVLLGWPGDEMGMQIHELTGAGDTIQFSPDGKTIALGGTGQSTDGAADGEPRDLPWLWLLSAETGAIQLSKGITGVDSLEWRTYLSDVCWSPDGSMIGVSLGKGHAVGALSSKDGSVIWTGDFQGGRMNEIFDTSWTDTNILLTGFGATWLVDPQNPASPVRLERLARATLLDLDGTDDVLILNGNRIQRLNPRTGEVPWSF